MKLLRVKRIQLFFDRTKDIAVSLALSLLSYKVP